jgi:hypothetical protein
MLAKLRSSRENVAQKNCSHLFEDLPEPVSPMITTLMADDRLLLDTVEVAADMSLTQSIVQDETKEKGICHRSCIQC